MNYFIPTASQILNLKIGDLAPNSLSKDWQPVTEIFGRGLTPDGKEFVCYYTRLGENSTISHSLVADKLDRTVGLINNHTSHELDEIEKQMLMEKHNA